MKGLELLLTAGLLTSCGVVGAPVAPETVGVAPTIEQQKKQHDLEAQQREADAGESDPALQGQDVNLPPLQPEGTR